MANPIDDVTTIPGRMPAKPSRRGFASMDRAKQAAIASKGGKAAHKKGTAHEFTSEEAKIAGTKGGIAVSANREHMAAIGKLGGQRRYMRRMEEESKKKNKKVS